MLAIFVRNTVASIADRYHRKLLVVVTGPNSHRPLWRSKFDGVCHQVIEYLLHTLRINIEQESGGSNILVEQYPSLTGLRLQATYHLPGQHVKVDLLLFDRKLPHVRARHKEDIFNNRDKLLHALSGIAKILLLLSSQIAHTPL